MPSIQFLCSSCQHRLQVDQSQQGKQAICPMCGAQVAVPVVEAAATATLGPGAQPNLGPQPASTPFQRSQPSGAYSPPYQQPGSCYPVRQPTEPFAIVSLVCSLVGIVCWIGSIVGIVFGHLAISRIKASGEQLGGRGFATAGLVVGYVWLCLMFVLVVFYLIFVMTFFVGMMEAVHEFGDVKINVQESIDEDRDAVVAPEGNDPTPDDEDIGKPAAVSPFEVIDEPASELPKFDGIKSNAEKPSPPDSEEVP